MKTVPVNKIELKNGDVFSRDEATELTLVVEGAIPRYACIATIESTALIPIEAINIIEHSPAISIPDQLATQPATITVDPQEPAPPPAPAQPAHPAEETYCPVHARPMKQSKFNPGLYCSALVNPPGQPKAYCHWVFDHDGLHEKG